MFNVVSFKYWDCRIVIDILNFTVLSVRKFRVSGKNYFSEPELSYRTSVSDPDPCGSVLKWPPWIRILIGNTDPDPGQSKWCPKRKKI